MGRYVVDDLAKQDQPPSLIRFSQSPIPALVAAIALVSHLGILII